MKRKIKCGDDVERALERRGIEWQNGRGKTREAQLDERTYSTLRWQEGEEFSEPRAAYFEGILRVFGIIALVAAFMFAFYLMTLI